MTLIEYTAEIIEKLLQNNELDDIIKRGNVYEVQTLDDKTIRYAWD